MIEKYVIKNTDTLKRWRKFKSQKRSLFACWCFIFILFLSLTAEFWANNKPIVMLYKGDIYFPVIVHYHPTDLNLKTDLSVVHYKKLDFSKKDWVIWPLVTWDPFESNTDVAYYPSKPTKDNWLGTDDRGRDVLARLIYGFRYSIGFALMVWLISYSLGTILGGIMGFVGGKLDLISQRCVEIIESVPFLLLLITLVDLIGGGSHFWVLVILMASFRWINISHYMRAEFLKIKQKEFVAICRVQGMGHFRTMFKHILPNALTAIITLSPFSLANGISSLVILDYLGFGLVPPTPSWGELLSQAEKHFTLGWWLALYPSLALFSTLMIIISIGEGIRVAFDPRHTS